MYPVFSVIFNRIESLSLNVILRQLVIKTTCHRIIKKSNDLFLALQQQLQAAEMFRFGH